MSGPHLNDSLWLLSRARGASLAARLVILAVPILATLNTSFAAGSPFLLSSAVIVVLAAGCAVVPDSHLGLIVIVMLAVEWTIRVQDPLTPWSIGLAGLIAVFHITMTFAGIAPAGADMPRSLYVPWVRRALLSIGPPIAVWSAIVALDSADLGVQAALVAAGLIALAIVTYWSPGTQ